MVITNREVTKVAWSICFMHQRRRRRKTQEVTASEAAATEIRMEISVHPHNKIQKTLCVRACVQVSAPVFPLWPGVPSCSGRPCPLHQLSGFYRLSGQLCRLKVERVDFKRKDRRLRPRLVKGYDAKKNCRKRFSGCDVRLICLQEETRWLMRCDVGASGWIKELVWCGWMGRMHHGKEGKTQCRHGRCISPGVPKCIMLLFFLDLFNRHIYFRVMLHSLRVLLGELSLHFLLTVSNHLALADPSPLSWARPPDTIHQRTKTLRDAPLHFGVFVLFFNDNRTGKRFRKCFSFFFFFYEQSHGWDEASGLKLKGEREPKLKIRVGKKKGAKEVCTAYFWSNGRMLVENEKVEKLRVIPEGVQSMSLT